MMRWRSPVGIMSPLAGPRAGHRSCEIIEIRPRRGRKQVAGGKRSAAPGWHAMRGQSPGRGGRRPFMSIISVAPAGAPTRSTPDPGAASRFAGLAPGYLLIAAPRLTSHFFTPSQPGATGTSATKRSIVSTHLEGLCLRSPRWRAARAGKSAAPLSRNTSPFC